MLTKGASAGAVLLFRHLGVESSVFLSRNALSATATAHLDTVATPDDLRNAIHNLSGQRLRELSTIARSCQAPTRCPKRKDPLLQATLRALNTVPAPTSSTYSNFNVPSTPFASDTPPQIAPQDLVPALQQMVLSSSRHQAQLCAIADSAVAAMADLDPEQIADLALGFAQLGHFDIRFKSRVADEAVSRITQFSPSALANLAWAFGELQYFDLLLMSSILPVVQANCDAYSASDLAKVLWAYARVGYRDDSLLDIMAAMAAKMDSDFCPKTLSEVVFATAGLGWADPGVHAAIAEHAQDNVAEYDAESLGKIVFGLASCGCDDDSLFEAVAQHALSILDTMRPVDLARVMWALSQMGYYHKELLAKVTEEALPATMHLYDRDELKMLIGACNKLGCTTQSVADAAALLQERETALPETKFTFPGATM